MQQYAAPQQYPAPTGADAAFGRSRSNTGEVIVDFATVGTLASIAVIARQDVNSSAGTFLVGAGALGGGALGWLLTEKYNVDAGTAHATTIGLLVGIANGALLVQPTHWNDSDQVLGLLFTGSAVGSVAGFALGQHAELTPGQSTFVANLVMLGSATASFTAIAGSRDDDFGNWEAGVLAVGVDAGVLAGALIAPHLDWSPRRAKIVFASTVIGALAGGMIAGLLDKRDDSSNGDLITGCMTAGLWGGLGLGVYMTADDDPDPRFPRSRQGSTVTLAPYVHDHGQVGVMAGGTW